MREDSEKRRSKHRSPTYLPRYLTRPYQRDSAYLSKPSPDHTALPAVLEQLFEDLNSYSETSIPLDGFNSLELKLFPFYRRCHFSVISAYEDQRPIAQQILPIARTGMSLLLLLTSMRTKTTTGILRLQGSVSLSMGSIMSRRLQSLPRRTRL